MIFYAYKQIDKNLISYKSYIQKNWRLYLPKKSILKGSGLITINSDTRIFEDLFEIEIIGNIETMIAGIIKPLKISFVKKLYILKIQNVLMKKSGILNK